MKLTESKEWYFFKFAYPCMHVLLDNGSLSQEEFDKLTELYEQGIAPEKGVLERVFLAAFRRIKNTSNNHWDWNTLKNYWEGMEHTKAIDAREGNYSKFPEIFCETCKVKEGTVVSIDETNGKTILELDIMGDKRKFIQGKHLEANVNDIVLTHLAYAVQKK